MSHTIPASNWMPANRYWTIGLALSVRLAESTTSTCTQAEVRHRTSLRLAVAATGRCSHSDTSERSNGPGAPADGATYKIRSVNKEVVGAKGFEPSTSWSRTRRASQAALRPDTHDRLVCARATA